MDPATPLTLAILILAYAGASPFSNRRPNPRQLASFAAGLLALIVTLAGPLDRLAQERSFSIYVFQQMLLVFVVPPLLLAGVPDWMLRPLLLNRWVEPVARIVTRPLFAFLFFSAVFTLVHYPVVCDRVCQLHPLFGDVHTLLLGTGLILWFPLLSPLPEYPRLSYPMQVLFVFMLTIPMTAVAAPITMAQTVLYAYYFEGPHPLGLTPMADQVLGGLIMWIGQGVYLMFVFTAIFFRWAQRDDEEMPPINRQPAAVQALRARHHRIA